MSRNKQSMHAELETVLSELHLSMERREAILAAAGRMTERENRRRPLRTGLMAAAICAALAVTAVAVSPPLRETLVQFLGSFEPYAQEVEGVSATDQGIELRVVRVLADKNGGTAYLEAEDLAGERRMRLVSLALVLLPFFVSMVVTNDVALITFVPFAVLVLGLIGRTEYLAPLVVLQTMAANLGSMATPVGNPQNLYLYADYELTAEQFFGTMLPLTLVSLAVLTAASLLCVRDEGIQVRFQEQAELRRPGRLGLMAGLFVLCLLSVFRVLPYPALLAVVAGGLLLFDRGLFRRVDYGLLATFFCFFLFAGNIGACGPVHAALASLMEGHTALTTGLTSQIISNVPAAVLLSGFTADWRGLLVGSNLGGLGTPIASLASLISLKVYLRTPGARPGRYLLLFTAANGAALVLLCLCAALLAG